METATAVAQETLTLYAVDAPEHIIELNTRPEGPPRIVRHKLRKPTFAELEARDRKQAAETTTYGNEEFIEAAGSGPDLELWGKICVAAQGYQPNGEWLTGDALADIPVAHKLCAIRNLHESEYEVIADDGDLDYFVIGATETKVKQTIGHFQLIHTLREMTEKERGEFEGKSYRASFIRGKGKETRTRIVGNLKAFVDLYNKLIQAVDGISGETVHLDPIFKRGVINTMLASQTAIASD